MSDETTVEEDFKKIILDSSTWSFSRLSSFDQCPYAWKRNYIDCEKKENNAFAEYGTLCHSLLERYEKGELDMFSLPEQYEKEYYDVVQHDFPPNKYVDLNTKYHDRGYDYFSTMNWEFDGCEILGVEEEIHFDIDNHPFVGYIDLRYKDADGKIILRDHKSSTPSFTKKTHKPTSGFADKMKMYERQQYLYSKYFIEKNIKIDFLEWNFFNTGDIYRISWDNEEYKEALKWASDTIKQIYACENFAPNPSMYFCHYICDYRNNCSYTTA